MLTNNDKLFIFFTDLEEELKGEVLEVTYSKIGIGKYNAKILIPQKSEIIDYKKQYIRIVREEKFLIKKYLKLDIKINRINSNIIENETCYFNHTIVC